MPLQIEYSPFWKRVILDPVLPSLGVGVATGTTGVILGGFGGIAVSAHPGLFSALAGAQCFTLGTSFSYCRSALVAGLANGRPTRRQELQYSTVAGAVSGAFTGALRSRSNIIPGAIVLGFLGFAGQKGVHSIPTFYNPEKVRRPWMQSILESPWVPLKALSDDDYEIMLQERLLRTEAEIALVDEKLAALRPMSAEATKPNGAESTT